MSSEKIKKQIIIITKLISLYQQLWQKMYGGKIPCILHHTATSQMGTSFRTVNQNHRLAGYPKSKLGYYCAYTYLIDGRGIVHQARSLKEAGQATRTFKKFHFDICLCGSFNDSVPSQAQLQSLENLLVKLTTNNNLGSIEPHRKYLNTICCGKNLIKYLDERK